MCLRQDCRDVAVAPCNAICLCVGCQPVLRRLRTSSRALWVAVRTSEMHRLSIDLYTSARSTASHPLSHSTTCMLICPALPPPPPQTPNSRLNRTLSSRLVNSAASRPSTARHHRLSVAFPLTATAKRRMPLRRIITQIRSQQRQRGQVCCELAHASDSSSCLHQSWLLRQAVSSVLPVKATSPFSACRPT